MGVHWKIRFLAGGGGGGVRKKLFFGGGESAKGGGLVCRFKRGLGKKEKKKGLCFWSGRGEGGSWEPNVHYELEEPSY